MSKAALIAEFLLLFVALPLGYRFSPRPLPALPVLWLVAAYCYWQLRRDSGFARGALWNTGPLGGQIVSILIIFVVCAVGIWLGVRLFAPELLFNFVKARPVLWGLVMVLYPVVSVYPQGLVYRSFLMHRYAGMLPTVGLIVASASAFAFMHIVFRNPLAVGMTFVGGLLFAWRYDATESLLTSSVEHALYGCWLFTVGLGQYFYHGRVQLR